MLESQEFSISNTFSLEKYYYLHLTHTVFLENYPLNMLKNRAFSVCTSVFSDATELLTRKVSSGNRDFRCPDYCLVLGSPGYGDGEGDLDNGNHVVGSNLAT